jgi:hypothetical protein
MIPDDFPNRQYFSFDPALGYPAGDAVYYECIKCGAVIASLPEDSITCKCYNIMIDVGYGRIVVRDFNYLRVFHKRVGDSGE